LSQKDYELLERETTKLQDEAQILQDEFDKENRRKQELQQGVSNLCAKLQVPETGELGEDLQTCHRKAGQLRQEWLGQRSRSVQKSPALSMASNIRVKVQQQ
jgi:hypothetical protein